MMRCMAIAGELARLQGGTEEIRFVCADEESGALAADNGFRSHVLGTDYRDMESELPWWEQQLGKFSTARTTGPKETLSVGAAGRGSGGAGRPAVLVDSYHVTDSYLQALGRRAYVIVMDDMGTHRYPGDCVVNYNAPAQETAYEELYRGTGAKLLIGSRYVPLRRQFWDKGEKGQDHIRNAAEEPVRDVLITAGGGDSENIAGRILERIYSREYFFHVVSGRFHPCFRELEALGRAHDNIRVHHDVKDMAALMGRGQAGVTAGAPRYMSWRRWECPSYAFPARKIRRPSRNMWEGGRWEASQGRGIKTGKRLWKLWEGFLGSWRHALSCAAATARQAGR